MGAVVLQRTQRICRDLRVRRVDDTTVFLHLAQFENRGLRLEAEDTSSLLVSDVEGA